MTNVILEGRGADDSRARLGTSEASCRLSPSYVAGQSSSNGGRQGRSGNLGSVYHEILYQRQPPSLWPNTLYGEVLFSG